MNLYRADLHIHTCLSPCGSLDMSPTVIVETALARGLDIIAVTDHNSTLQCPEIQALGAEAGLTVIAGAEVCTREEAHCLALFGTEEARVAFQQYLDRHLPSVPNDPERFGDQVWVNRNDEIMGEAPCLLISALDRNVNHVAAVVKGLGGLFVAAHVERPSFSLISQLGFIDPSLPLDAIEYTDASRFARLLSEQKYLSKYICYQASDAHYPEQIGSKPCLIRASAPLFDNIRMAYSGSQDHLILSSG